MKIALKCLVLIALLGIILYILHLCNSKKNDLIEYKTDQLLQNKNANFIVDKIIMYSSANAINTEKGQHPYWILSIYQFTDFAIYIKINENTNKEEIDIKEIWVENIKIEDLPEFGTPRLLYKKC